MRAALKYKESSGVQELSYVGRAITNGILGAARSWKAHQKIAVELDAMEKRAGANFLNDALRAQPEATIGFTAPETQMLLGFLEKLKKRPAAVLKWRFGIKGPKMTTVQIGIKLGITTEGARQIEVRAIRKLRILMTGEQA